MKAINTINGFGDDDDAVQELELLLEPATKKQRTRTAYEFTNTAATSDAEPVSESAPD